MMPRTLLAAYFLCLSGASSPAAPADVLAQGEAAVPGKLKCAPSDGSAPNHECTAGQYCNKAGADIASTDSLESVCIDPLKVLSAAGPATAEKPLCKNDAEGLFFSCAVGKICTPAGSDRDSVCVASAPAPVAEATRDCADTAGTGNCMCADILCASDAQCDPTSKTCDAAACVEEIPAGGTYKGCQATTIIIDTKPQTCLNWDDAEISKYVDEEVRNTKDAAEKIKRDAYLKSLNAFKASLTASGGTIHNYCRTIGKEKTRPSCYVNTASGGDPVIVFGACHPKGVKECEKDEEDKIKWTGVTTKLCLCGGLCNENDGHQYCYDDTCHTAKKVVAAGSTTEEGMSKTTIALIVTGGVAVVALIGVAVWYFTREPPRKRARRARR